MNPLVSIIIPTYNHSSFLKEAIESIINQSFQNWEALIIDNYSVDDTVKVINSFKDPRIFHELHRNRGVIASSRNKGISLSKGKYIAFLDSDDRWHPEKLNTCIYYLNQGYELVAHGLRWFGEREKDYFCGPIEKTSYNSLLKYGNCLTPSATVVVKEKLISVKCFSEDPDLVSSEDYHLWIKLSLKNIKVFVIKDILGDYRIHSNNESSKVEKHLNSVLKAVNSFFPVPKEQSIGLFLLNYT